MWTLIPATTITYGVAVAQSTGHWRRNGTNHGAKSNPRFMHVSLVKLHTEAASRGTPGPANSGLRLWLYFRGGYAWHCDITVRRGDLKRCPSCDAILADQ